MTEFKVPELGENVAGGDVMRVLVNVGDTITRDQPVLELETDKATIEVPSSVAGVVKEIHVKKGDKVKVGAVVLTVDDAAPAATARGAAGRGRRRPPKPKPRPARQPDAARRRRRRPQPPNRVARRCRPQRRRQQASDAGAGAPAPRPRARPRRQRGPERRVRDGPVAPASPAVRRLAREIGVDIDEVQGTGPGGRISQDDVKEHARRILSSVGRRAGGGAAGRPARAARPLPDFQKWGEVERQPWSNIRRVTAEHLSYAWNTIPHVTQFDKADVTRARGAAEEVQGPGRARPAAT